MPFCGQMAENGQNITNGEVKTMKRVEDYVRTIPDFPEPGIMFRDVTSVLQDADGLQLAIQGVEKLLEGLEFDAVNEALPEHKEKWENDTRKIWADYYIDDKAIRPDEL